MEAIVLKVLKKYLKLFIKNFTSDNFSLSLLKGEGQLVDLELNENVIQELLLIPPQLRVTQASCDSLVAKVPWTSYKKEPITMSLQTIQINLKEPDVIQPLQPQFKKFKKKNKNKRNEVTENLQIEVKKLKLSVSTRDGNSLIVEVDDVLIQSTNSSFQVVDLTQIKTINKEQGIESLHKLITAKSISIKVQDIGGMSYPIIDNMPFKILFSSQRRIKDWIQLNAKLEFLLGSLQLQWTLSQWHLFSDLFSQFQSILARAAPPPLTLDTPVSGKKDKKSKKKESSSSLKGSQSPSLMGLGDSVGSISSSPAVIRKNGDQLAQQQPPSMNSSFESVSLGVSSPTSSISSVTSATGTPVSTPSINVLPPVEEAPLPKHSDVTYDFHIDRWKLSLIDNISAAADSSDSGFLFHGDGLHFGFTSNNVNFKPTNEYGEIIYSLPIRESIVSVVMNSLQVKEMESISRQVVKSDLCGHNNESKKPMEKKYDASITSISSDGISERVQIHHYQGPYLLKGNLMLRKPIVTDSDPDPLKRLIGADGKPLYPLIGLELNLHLSHFKVIGDRNAWKRLISFLRPPLPESESESESESSLSGSMVIDPSQSTEQNILNNSTGLNGISSPNITTNSNVNLSTVNHDGSPLTNGSPAVNPSPFAIKKGVLDKGKKKISSFKRKFKLGDNWKNQIKITLKATELLVVIPEEKNIDEFKGMSTKIHLGTFAMRNHSDWKSVPYLYEGLQLIDTNLKPDPITQSGLDHRFSFKMENVSILVNDPSNTSTTVLEPAGVLLYLRVSRSNYLLNEKRVPKIDLSFISSDFNFRLNTIQSLYLDHIAKKYLSPKKLKNLLRSRIKSIKSIAKKRLQLMKNQKMDRTLTIKKKVEKTLQEYYWSAHICIQKGVFYLPLQYLLEPKSKKKSIGESMLSQFVHAIKPSQVGVSEDLSQFKVEMLGMALQNKQEGQNIVFKVGTFEAHGIEHPKLTTSTTLSPLQIPDDELIPAAQTDKTNLLIHYKRRPKKANIQLVSVDAEMNEWLTEVNVRLQGMQVKVLKKKQTASSTTTTTQSSDGSTTNTTLSTTSTSGTTPASKSKGLKIPDLQNFITKLVSTLENKKDNISNLKKGIKKVKLDIVWGIELGNCEILMGDKGKSAEGGVYRPKGTIKITDTNRRVNALEYKNIEQELIKKNMESARSEEDRDVYEKRINDLLVEIEKLKSQPLIELQQLQKEYMELECKFVENKSKLAELQDDNETLKYQLSIKGKK